MRAALLTLTAALAISAPAAAATLEVQDTVGIVYSARSGEVNRLKVGVALPDLTSAPFTEYSAPLQLGAGCVAGTPIVCSGGRVVVHLGDRNDVASVVPFNISASVFAGAGDDDVFADGLSGAVDGGSGNDVLRVGADGLARADGGPGDDQIAGTSGVPLFRGGAGDDLIVGTGTAGNDIQGQQGNDALVASGRRGGSMAGNAGDDVITFLATDSETEGWTFDAGRGDDIISGAAPVVDAGPGDDRISVVGGTVASTVTCGKGFDVVWADSDDVLGADCERRIDASSPPALPGVAEARTRAQALLNHFPQPDPAAS